MSRPLIVPYEHGALCALLAEVSGNQKGAIEQKVHAAYLKEYLRELKAETIVVEADYIDHDFLEDFSAYYVRCFAPYSRYCSRIHFFSSEFDANEFSRIFECNEEMQRRLQNSYLGFIVVRPLPQRIIGRTCLATYKPGNERRFPAARRCNASLFGLQLTVNSIAFQEQDRAVSACATSALWSVFQGTGHHFHHRIPSPAEITRKATATNPLDGRAFPAGDGLMFVQMADAVRACELEPLWLPYTQAFYVRAAIHGYLCAGIPLLLSGEIRRPLQPAGTGTEEPQEDASNEEQMDCAESVGIHAVAVVGYRLESRRAGPEPEDGFRMRSSRISKLYCHDDGVGPFARMEFLAAPEGKALLSTSQASSAGKIGTWKFAPETILVPLYHKIRVPFIRVYEEVRSFDNYLRVIAELGGDDAPNLRDLEWDIRLTTVNDYKQELLNKPGAIAREQTLHSNLPRYLWLARAEDSGGAAFDLLFDATGLEASNLCLRIVELGSAVPRFVAALRAEQSANYPGCEGVLETIASV